MKTGIDLCATLRRYPVNELILLQFDLIFRNLINGDNNHDHYDKAKTLIKKKGQARKIAPEVNVQKNKILPSIDPEQRSGMITEAAYLLAEQRSFQGGPRWMIGYRRKRMPMPVFQLKTDITSP